LTTVRRGYRIRVYPSAAQRQMLNRSFGAVRWLWNTTLSIRSEGYRCAGLRLWGVELSRWLTQWKKTPGTQWLAEIPATCLTQCLRDQDRTFANFFAKGGSTPG
jgi:putative transposase